MLAGLGCGSNVSVRVHGGLSREALRRFASRIGFVGSGDSSVRAVVSVKQVKPS